MEKMQNIKIEGYRNHWSAIAKGKASGRIYYLMENDIYGDETCLLVIDTKGNVICETYDDIETALKDEGIIK